MDNSFIVLHDKVRSEAQKLSNADGPRQQYAFAIFCSIVEHAHGTHSLLEKNPNVAVLILRATLEAQVHLILTNKLPDYHERQQRTILEGKLSRLLEEELSRLQHDKDKVYRHFPNLTDKQVDDEIKDIKSKIAKYEKKKIKQFKKWNARFDEVGDKEKYILYQKLCDHVHHDIDVLYDRHLADKNQLGELTMFKLPDNCNEEGIIGESAYILVDSLKLLAKVLDQDSKLDLEGIDAEYLTFMSTLKK